MLTKIHFFGGNGHCAARLDAVRALLEERPDPPCIAPFQIYETPYPGFEGRPGAPDLETFLRRLQENVEREMTHSAPHLLYATGIGGLIALTLRARGASSDTPILLQGPVLWGLERRMMPRLMRMCRLYRMLGPLFKRPAFQRRFARRYFVCPPEPERMTTFFQGYAACAALPDLFQWCTLDLLRDLERRFQASPALLENIHVWWGKQDRVVDWTQELRWTEAALNVQWPLKLFEKWGHYPMMDDPRGWVDELSSALPAILKGKS